MPNLTGIDFDLKGIGHILKNYFFKVPNYQRSYRWEKTDVEDLLKDVTDAKLNNVKTYFLGTVVLYKKEGERIDIVDGQQRIVTISIILASIRDYFNKNHGDDGRRNAEDIDRDYLLTRDRHSGNYEARVILNPIDNDFFYRRVLKSSSASKDAIVEKTESHKRLREAAILSRSFIERIASTTNDPSRSLLELEDYIQKNALVMQVIVPSDANAFTLFETLNVRGKALDLADKVKNYMFYRSGDRIEEAQQSWISVLNCVEDKYLETFIQYFWSSKHGLTRKNKLYSDLVDGITQVQSAVEFAKELEENAKIYSAILNPRAEFWDKYGYSARKNIETLTKDLRQSRVRYLLLSILTTFSKAEVEKSLQLLVSISVRFLVAGVIGGGGTQERRYCQHASEIRGGKIKTAKQLLEALIDIVPMDNAFQDQFEVVIVSSSHLARYYLRTLEDCFRGESGEELVANDDPRSVNREHILPEHPSAVWGDIDPNISRDFFNRLGNQALLRHKINSEIGNQGFEAKKPFFRDSQLALTQEIAEYESWGTTEIEERQKKLAKLAVKAWKIKI